MSLETFRKSFMPYVLRRLPDSNKWMVLNREYMPLGSTQRDGSVWHEREDYAVPLKMTKALRQKLADLGATHNSSDDDIWLYNDATAPTSKRAKDIYLAKIRLLMDLKVI